MPLLLIIVIVAILVINAIILWLVFFRSKKPESDTGLKLILQQMNELTGAVNSGSRLMNESAQNQFSNSQKLIKDINEQVTSHLLSVVKGVTEANEASKQIFTVADQLKNLEKVLKHQKQRGNLGEASLELILSNILPPTAYKIQYTFEDGEKVDAVIITKDGLIPVDAKFSLDNYNRVINETNETYKLELEKEFTNDLKKRINETAKYIKPQEKTLPFAFMFIPAEAIYYDLLVNEVGSVKVNTRSLIDYAYNEKKVIIVSPTTFAAYLQSVLFGFRAFKIEESAKEIRKRVEELGKHIGAYDQFMNSLGKNLDTTVGTYNKAHNELKKIDKDVLRITGESPGVEPLAIDKVQKEE